MRILISKVCNPLWKEFVKLCKFFSTLHNHFQRNLTYFCFLNHAIQGLRSSIQRVYRIRKIQGLYCQILIINLRKIIILQFLNCKRFLRIILILSASLLYQSSYSSLRVLHKHISHSSIFSSFLFISMYPLLSVSL